MLNEHHLLMVVIWNIERMVPASARVYQTNRREDLTQSLSLAELPEMIMILIMAFPFNPIKGWERVLHHEQGLARTVLTDIPGNLLGAAKLNSALMLLD